MIHVCVDAATYLKQPWPDWLRERLAQAGPAHS
jgi:acyl-CoA thioester hydrolase